MAKQKPLRRPAPSPTPEQIEQLRLVGRIQLGQLIGGAITRAIPWAGLLGCLYMCVLIARALAGQHTFADIGIHVLGKIQISEAVAWIFGTGGVGYGLRQRNLRLIVNETQGTRISELERELDNRRTSSALTRRGQTNPRDKP